MSKAVMGAALLTAAGGLFAAATGGLGLAAEGTLMGSSVFAAHGVAIMTALALQGTAMEAGAIADALSQNRGSNITTRQPAAFRQIVLGNQRVGGVMVYASTTGGNHDHYHRVVVLAGHVCHSILNVYLDGRKVYWGGTGAGYQTRNGVAFGGWCDSSDHIGPDGNHYNFNGNLVYCEARYGDQLPGDVMQSLTTNDSQWAAGPNGSPYLGGCTYVYLQISNDPTMFPNGAQTEVRFDVNGKSDIYDPRTGQTGFTTNWALLVADRMTDAKLGLGMDLSEINTEQLIAAANVCDEMVPLAAGGTEARYSCSWHGDTSTGPGDVISGMMNAAAGRLSRIGGQWYIWPAYWQGPSFEFSEGVLLGDEFSWTPYRSIKDRFNRITGTYIAPNYPYNTAGNLYDANSWYDGTQQDNFEYGYQPTNFPQFAMDVAHGYPADQWLTEDGGNPLPMEVQMNCTLSVAQAQRVAKILLMRNRKEGTGTLSCSLATWGMQPVDVMEFTFAKRGWQNKVLEITDTTLHVEERGGPNGQRAVACWLTHQVAETGPEVYEWNPASGDEETVYAVPAGLAQTPYVVAPPTGVSLVTATSQGSHSGIGGNSTNYGVLVSWITPADVLVVSIECQAKEHSSSTWLDAFDASVASNSGMVYGVSQGDQVDVQIRAVRSNGAPSQWVQPSTYTV